MGEKAPDFVDALLSLPLPYRYINTISVCSSLLTRIQGRIRYAHTVGNRVTFDRATFDLPSLHRPLMPPQNALAETILLSYNSAVNLTRAQTGSAVAPTSHRWEGGADVYARKI